MSLRAILLVLALVPCFALVALGAMNSAQLYGDWKTVNDRNESAKGFGTPLVTVFFSLQAERRLSVAVLANPKAGQSELTRQRGITDKSVQSLEALGAAPPSLSGAFRQVTAGLKELPGYRAAVDQRSGNQQQTYDDYTDVIAKDMELLEDFSNVGFGETSVLVRPALDAQWGLEMLAREDTIIAAGVASGRLTSEQRLQLAGAIGSQGHIYDDKVLPQLPAARAKNYQAVLSGTAWKQKTAVEQSLLNIKDADGAGRTAVSAKLGKDWQQSLGGITPQLMQASTAYSTDLKAATGDQLDDLITNMVVNSAVSAAAVVLMLVISLRLTGILRRRIFALRAEALELQTKLPDIVERLRQGEKVDTDAELPEVAHGDDELGQLGQALNQARNSSLETAVREVELYRGFERLLQRIARRTQLLIGMQLKRLGEMQRRHEDPEVLEGLFDLDHLAARLRRYEENLVILGSGQPQRRWRRPVLLLDVLRSAQGEVQDYRRIRIETDGETWLSERAVGPMVHLLAELMENAVSFSRPPTPVEVTASQVGRGVAIEIEDRGMGMDPEQYAEANAMMAEPPRMDVMSRADDARLGLYVVARLSANLGLKVELRPSSFGGTRVVVLVPGELITGGEAVPLPRHAPAAVPDRPALHAATGPRPGPLTGSRPGPLNDNPRPRPLDDHTRPGPRPHPGGDQEAVSRPLIGPWVTPPARPSQDQAPAPAPAPAPAQAHTASSDPLPRRVRQANLVTELRQPPPAYPAAEPPRTGPAAGQPLPRRTGARSGATVGAFQRQSRASRLRPDADHQPTHPSPGPDRTRKEDGR
ncbi:nitrate- and nitrite sensing domain-containing protein [Streptomyces sp. NBC_00878]|uniref:sensor histidine kinase n=1 Tax=Streptomyces sp. NBC_00878 TaxID=2975854 RepID=UPI00224CA18B|nr:nitrate- and nitrite sensing domain-containing protein [Streptomyces sp. NBC_00878]MCX4908550.1 nitrate- and nitrite sensing domain-containing protein [Streptomyces sp. NBC_00878]